MRHLLILLSLLLPPISVFGFDWTVSYDMKKLYGSFEYLELSVPKVFKDSNWKLPNQVGSWECSLSRFDKKNYT